jgi:hypothetical protein
LVTTGSITVISATATVISATVTSATVASATAATMAADSTGLRVFTGSQEHTPVRSVALIMAEMPEVFPPAAGRALEVAPMAVVDDIK